MCDIRVTSCYVPVTIVKSSESRDICAFPFLDQGQKGLRSFLTWEKILVVSCQI